MRELLVIRLSALGDVAMTVPVICRCAEAWPQVRLRVVTTAFCARLFQNAPENVLVTGLTSEETHGLIGTWRLLRRLHRLGRPDAVADLHNVLRSWVIDASFWIRGCRVVMVDKERRRRHAVLKGREAATPFITRYFEVFARLGLPVDNPSSPLERWSSPYSPLPTPLVGIAPFARYATKTYPEELMRRVVALLRERGIRVMLFGSRGEEAGRLDEWAAGDEGIEVVAGKYSIEEELVLMSRLAVMVTMDSANHHLASLVGTRVVSIWGGTTPSCGFMAWGQREEDALVAGVACQPCSIAGSAHCKEGTLLCMRSLSPERIVDAVVRAANRQEQ